jgi:hypothetical protein
MGGEERPLANPRRGNACRQSSVVSRHFLIAVLLAATMSGCGTTPKAPPSRPGGYYLDDGPGAKPPANLDSIPDAVPRVETINRGTARPYVVMGKSYTPMTSLGPYKARGIATTMENRLPRARPTTCTP